MPELITMLCVFVIIVIGLREVYLFFFFGASRFHLPLPSGTGLNLVFGVSFIVLFM